MHFVCTQACGDEDLPANLTRSCDKLPKEISQPDKISDDAVNVLDQLRNATANSVQLVEKNRQAYKSCQNSTVSASSHMYTYVYVYMYSFFLLLRICNEFMCETCLFGILG